MCAAILTCLGKGNFLEYMKSAPIALAVVIAWSKQKTNKNKQIRPKERESGKKRKKKGS